MPEGVPADVRTFLAGHVDSIEQLEILLLLHQNPETEWTAEQTAGALYGNPASAARRLQRLHADGLLVQGGGDDAAYRYAPRTPALAESVERLAHTYRERRVAVTTLIASRPMDNVRAFSEAFRLGRRED